MSSPTRILLVEDDRGDARLVEELLSETGAPFEVETVPRLADGVARLRSDGASIDAVLLDLGLPDSQGLDTLRALYAEVPDAAIVVLTGLDDDAVGLEAVKLGAQDYLPKGRISADVLGRVIGYARERKSAERSLTAANATLAAEVDGVTRLRRIGALFAGQADLRVVLDEVVAAAIAITGADKGCLQLLDAQSDTLRIAAQRGFEQPFLDFWDGVSENDGTCGSALAGTERVIVENITESRVFAGTPALDVHLAAGVQALQSTPLVSRDGATLGMISTHFRTPYQPDDRALHLLDLLARQTSDILERVAVEAAVIRERDTARNYLHIVGNMIVALDRDGSVTLVNPALCSVLGLAAEEIVGSDWFERFLPEAVGSEVKAVFDRMLRGDIALVEHYENPVVTADGEERLVAWHNAILRDDQGAIVGTLSSGEDVTERRRSESALRERSEELATILDILPALVWVGLDPECRVITGNRAANELTGTAAETNVSQTAAAAGEAVYLRQLKEDGGEYRPDELPMQRAIALGKPVREAEIDFRLSDGRQAYALGNAAPLFDAQGQVRGAVAAFTDITERKRAEKDLRRQTAVTAAVNRVLEGSLRAETDAEVALICLREAEELTGSMFGWIGEVNPSGRLDTIALSDPGWESCTIPGAEATIRELEIRGIFGRVVKDGASLITNEPGAHPDRVGLPSGHPELTAFMGVPLKQDGRTFGMIALGNKPSGYAPHDQEAIEALSVAFVEALQRKRAEEALRESERRFSSLFEHMLEGFAHCEMIFDDEGRPDDFVYLAVNPSFSRLTGLTDVVGRRISEVLPSVKAETPEILEIYGAVVTTGEPAEFEIDFTPLHKDLHVSATRESEGRFVAVFNDVTERKRVEAAEREAEVLRRSEELYREMFEGHSAAMFLTDPETGDIVTANQAAADFFGVPAESLSKMNVKDFSCTPRDRLVAGRDEAMKGSQGVFADIYRLADGSLRDVEVRMVPIRLRDRALLYAIVFDVTERKRAEDALRDRERQLAEAQRIAHVGSWTWDAATDTTARSDETCHIYGRTPAEMGTDPDIWLEYLHRDDRARAEEAIDRAMVEARPYLVDYRVVWPDGSEHIVRERGESLLDDEGHVVTIFGTVQDITEESLADAALRDRERQLAEAQRIAHIGGWTWDVATDTTARSDETCHIYGRTPAEMGTDPDIWLDFVHPDDRERAREVTERTEADGQPYAVDYRVTWPDGSEHAIRDTGEPVSDDGGRLVGCSGYVQDITEQSRVDAALRDRERQLAEAQRIAHVGSWSWDAASDKTTFSEETCRIYGHTPAEVGAVPYDWLEFVHPDDRARVREVIDRAEVDGTPYVIDYRLPWPDGSEHIARERGESLLDDEGHVVTIFGTVQDITEQSRFEDELRRRAEELERFNRAMVDREMRVIEMKEAVNALSAKLGEEPPYPEVWRGAGGGEEAAT